MDSWNHIKYSHRVIKFYIIKSKLKYLSLVAFYEIDALKILYTSVALKDIFQLFLKCVKENKISLTVLVMSQVYTNSKK